MLIGPEAVAQPERGDHPRTPAEASNIVPPRHKAISPRGCGQAVTVQKFRPFAAKVWKRGRWTREAPKDRTLRGMREMRRCAASPSHRKAMRRTWRDAKQRFYRYRTYRRVAPYSGGGHWWAIPFYIVACESGGSWGAYNPSGALGPYQLLGWGAPWPVSGWHDKMAHHRIASQVWAGGAGASNWVCA